VSGPAAFLTAQWRHLALLNYDVDPSVLAPLVPRGTELDDWKGHVYASVVGFLFLETRVLGLPIPFHRNFEEVNLRFYVRRKADDGWRRGVVFVKEMVPRWAIATIARTLYNEKYVSVPMGHEVGTGAASYRWSVAGRENRLWARAEREAAPLESGSHEEFIAEHYWGYSVQRDGGTCEYHVTHPPWSVSAAAEAGLDCDVRRVYGEAFRPFLEAKPASAFLAAGSAVTVSRGVRI
jgi:hypothetical protein